MATVKRYGRVALVTGANKGIGYEIARGLAANGVPVLLGSRDAARGKEAARRLRTEDTHVEAVRLDVTDESTIRTAASQIDARFGRLGILVNNAGVNLEAWAKPGTVRLSVIRRVYDVHVFGTVAVTQAMLPLLLKSARGRVVNVSSALGSSRGMSDPAQSRNRPLLLGYSSSKSAQCSDAAVCE